MILWVSIMPSIFDLTDPRAVERAILECDRLGRDQFLRKYGFGKAREYFLIRNGRNYDSKAIVGVALGYQFPTAGALTASDFAGGEQTVWRVLTRLGFIVAKPGKATLPSWSNRPTVDLDDLDRRARKLRAFARIMRAPLVKPHGILSPRRVQTQVEAYARDPSVKAFILERAGGRCELCGVQPFLNRYREPFLEIHHVRRLADGGPDVVENAVALCPTCHREMHYGLRRGQLITNLRRQVPALKAGR
jgi:5-methylcytosine-specific restriction endonuclease McrA